METSGELKKGIEKGVPGGAGAVRPRDPTDNELSAEEKETFASVLAEGNGHKAPEPGAAPLALIAEDDPGVRRVLVKLLTAMGLRIVEVRDGGAALRAVRDIDPDLMLLDLKIPTIDGYQVVRGVRKHLNNEGLWILVLSGMNAQEDEMASLKLGADAFLGKPFELDHLEVRLKPFLRRLSAEVGERADPQEKTMENTEKTEENQEPKAKQKTPKEGQTAEASKAEAAPLDPYRLIPLSPEFY